MAEENGRVLGIVPIWWLGLGFISGFVAVCGVLILVLPLILDPMFGTSLKLAGRAYITIALTSFFSLLVYLYYQSTMAKFWEYQGKAPWPLQRIAKH